MNDKKPSKLNVVLAQINPIVGDVAYNTKKILNIIERNPNADIIIFPEMSLVGYPLMDHTNDPLIRDENKKSINILKKLNIKLTLILGTFTEPPELKRKIQSFYNSAIIIEKGEIKAIINKRLLPNYDVFDDRRYFSFNTDFKPIEIKGYKFGILICEDIRDEHYDIKSFPVRHARSTTFFKTSISLLKPNTVSLSVKSSLLIVPGH